jgi:2-dehydro-3-deoxygalactonokinase
MTAAGAPLSAVFLDVGSTNSRAWLVRGDEILLRETAAVGVRDSARDGSTARVREIVRALIASVTPSGAPVPIFAAGMITSSLGLLDVPHLPAPASAEDLARAAVEFRDVDLSPMPIVLIPGVRTDHDVHGSDVRNGHVHGGDAYGSDGQRKSEGLRDGQGEIALLESLERKDAAGRAQGAPDASLPFDVMRGEETLVCGLLARGLLDSGSALLNASSHWKLIRVDDQRRVAGSRTSLGGEVVHAVQSGTLLSASLPSGPLDAFSPPWLEAGATAGRRDGLLRALFGVRLLDQQRLATPTERFSWLAGACIAEDIDALLATRAIAPAMRIIVSGPAAVPAAWAHLLSTAGCHAIVLNTADVEQSFVTGLSTIARLHATLT